MKCPKCKKDYEKGRKAAYRLGLLAGREDQGRFLQKAVNNLEAVFGHLFAEIVRCDRENPLNSDPDYVHIKISKIILKKHIKKIRKHNYNVALFYQTALKEHEKKINCANIRIVEALKLPKIS